MATTQVSTLNQVITVFNKTIDFELASAFKFATSAVTVTKTPDNLTDSKPGSVVTWTKGKRMNTNTTALSETASGTAESLGDSQVSVTLLEHGNFVTTTERLEELAFSEIASMARKTVLENSARTSDQLYMEAADAETGADYNTYGPEGSRASKSLIVAGDIITADAVVDVEAKLAAFGVDKIETGTGDGYIMHSHAHVVSDLRANADFREVSLYARPEDRLKGEVGMYEGVRVILNNTVPLDYKSGEEAQAATTVSGAHSAADTTVDVVSGTGIIAGNVIVITDAAGDEWAHKIVSVSTNELTIGAAFRKNTFVYFGTGGLEVAMAGGESVEESAGVYTNYILGAEAFARAEAVTPNLRPSIDPTDAYMRQNRLAWYALWGVGIYEPKAVHKLFVSSSRQLNQ